MNLLALFADLPWLIEPLWLLVCAYYDPNDFVIVYGDGGTNFRVQQIGADHQKFWSKALPFTHAWGFQSIAHQTLMLIDCPEDNRYTFPLKLFKYGGSGMGETKLVAPNVASVGRLGHEHIVFFRKVGTECELFDLSTGAISSRFNSPIGLPSTTWLTTNDEVTPCIRRDGTDTCELWPHPGASRDACLISIPQDLCFLHSMTLGTRHLLALMCSFSDDDEEAVEYYLYLQDPRGSRWLLWRYSSSNPLAFVKACCVQDGETFVVVCNKQLQMCCLQADGVNHV